METVKHAKSRQLPYTVLAVVFLAIMLFPVYWMINTSLQPGPSSVNATILYSGLQGVPEELYEAGALDGATGWKAFRYITWPNLRPVVSVVLVLGVVYTLKVLDIILGLTGGGPANATQTLATNSYQQSFVQFSFGTGAAISNILVATSLIFTLVYLRLNRRAIDE